MLNLHIVFCSKTAHKNPKLWVIEYLLKKHIVIIIMCVNLQKNKPNYCDDYLVKNSSELLVY